MHGCGGCDYSTISLCSSLRLASILCAHSYRAQWPHKEVHWVKSCSPFWLHGGRYTDNLHVSSKRCWAIYLFEHWKWQEKGITTWGIEEAEVWERIYEQFELEAAAVTILCCKHVLSLSVIQVMLSLMVTWCSLCFFFMSNKFLIFFFSQTTRIPTDDDLYLNF